MVQDPRFRGGSSQAAPVVNISGTQPGWQSAAVLGILAMQFCLMAVIAARLLFPPETPVAELEQMAALQKSIEQLAATRTAEADSRAQLEVLDRFIGGQDPTAAGALSELSKKTAENALLKSSLRGQRDLIGTLDSNVDKLQKDLASSMDRGKSLDYRITRLGETIEGLKRQNDILEGDLLVANKGDAGETEDAVDEPLLSRWTMIGIGSAVAVLVLAGLALSVANSKKEAVEFDDSSDETSDETNN